MGGERTFSGTKRNFKRFKKFKGQKQQQKKKKDILSDEIDELTSQYSEVCISCELHV